LIRIRHHHRVGRVAAGGAPIQRRGVQGEGAVRGVPGEHGVGAPREQEPGRGDQGPDDAAE